MDSTPSREGPRVNEQIGVPEVRLIDENGENIGVVSRDDALTRAGDAGLDLVEISPGATPPVCKILDYGRFKYEDQKKKSEARKRQKTIDVKEIKMRPNIDQHDYEVKMRSIQRFLADGDKVKVTLRFRGREMAHQEFGVRLLERIKGDLEPYSIVESFPRLEGRQMVMLLAPKKTVVTKPVAAKHPTTKPEAGAGKPAKASPANAAESTAESSKLES